MVGLKWRLRSMVKNKKKMILFNMKTDESYNVNNSNNNKMMN